MRVHVLRHACAGRKAEWPGDDAARPLDEAGRAQAVALVPALVGVPLGRLLSSPTRRCVQTLEPLASSRRLPIQCTPVLAAGVPTEALVGLVVDRWSADAVLCTHGETMRPLLAWLRGYGVVPAAEPDDDLLGKGTAWTIEVVGGEPVGWTHLVPTPVEECGAHLASPS